MKTFIFIALALLTLNIPNIYGQNLQYKNTSIKVENDGGFSTIDNGVRYTISAAFSDADTLKKLFPQIANELRLSTDNNLVYSNLMPVDNMWDLIKSLRTDDGVLIYDAIRRWSVVIMYENNSLGLNLKDWKLNL